MYIPVCLFDEVGLFMYNLRLKSQVSRLVSCV